MEGPTQKTDHKNIAVQESCCCCCFCCCCCCLWKCCYAWASKVWKRTLLQCSIRKRITALRRVYTSHFCMRFPHCIAIFYYLPWLSKTKVTYIKLQRSGVNACGNRMCKLSFTFIYAIAERCLKEYFMRFQSFLCKAYWVYLEFKLKLKRDDYVWVTFEHLVKNWLKPSMQ